MEEKRNVTTDLDYYIDILIRDFPEYAEHRKKLLFVMSWMFRRISFMLNTGLDFCVGDKSKSFSFYDFRTIKDQSFFDRRIAPKLRKKHKI